MLPAQRRQVPGMVFVVMGDENLLDVQVFCSCKYLLAGSTLPRIDQQITKVVDVGIQARSTNWMVAKAHPKTSS